MAMAATVTEPRVTATSSSSNLAALAAVVAVAVVVAETPMPQLRSELAREQRVSWIERHVSAAGEVYKLMLSRNTD